MTTSQISDSSQNPSSVVDVTDTSDSEDESEDKILETGGGGRWQKNNQQVPRDVPGIDDAYLAMDTEEGVEVVWNEVVYSETKRTHKESKERLKNILQGLTDMKHQNIVNFYDFWHDKVGTKDRLVFVTEYITSGSLLQFLRKTKRTKGTNAVNDKIWRRWCRQILSAVSYLHKNDIIHGNLSLGSIFIQHNGLVKIGSVSPDAIHQHVKTKNAPMTTFHYKAPEYAGSIIKTPVDIYAFGMCALEMLNLDMIVSNGEGYHRVRMETIQRALEGMDQMKQEFIKLCLCKDPNERPTAQELLKHPVLQEVFNLKYLCTYALRDHIEEVQTYLDKTKEAYSDEDKTVLATIPSKGGREVLKNASQSDKIDIEKFCDEINQDFLLQEPTLLPIYSPRKKDETGNRLAQQSSSSMTDRNSNATYEAEQRKVTNLICVELQQPTESKVELEIKLQFEDKMERCLRSELQKSDCGEDLAMDLVWCGLLAEEDREKITRLINNKLEHVSWPEGMPVLSV